MITYNGLDLFSSGSSTITPGPVESRDAVADTPGAVGATVITQGLLPRSISQQGTLIADSPEALQSLIDSIALQVSDSSATLIDQHGNAWPNCLMRAMETQAFYRTGPRTAATYTVTYLQTHS